MSAVLAPMLATLADAPLDDPAWVYEPKYDGIRAIADVAAHGSAVRLWSRLGNEKTTQFPEVVEALAHWAASHDTAVVLDGEIVALSADGRPAGFQALQGRMHLGGAFGHRRPRTRAAAARTAAPDAAGGVAFIVFDVLRVGEHDLRSLPLTARREALEHLMADGQTPVLRLAEHVSGDGRALWQRAVDERWEGVIAKRADSRYVSGKRTTDWRKLKLTQEQEFVVGGFTSPRQSRTHFGALIVGVYEGSQLRYVSHVGTGFDARELARVMALLKAREQSSCPFEEAPPSPEPAHWVRPDLVAHVRFAEWTADGGLRHPVYLGLRDDLPSTHVVREHAALGHATSVTSPVSGAASVASPGAASAAASSVASGAASTSAPDSVSSPSGLTPLVRHFIGALHRLEDTRKDGVLEWPDGRALKVTNLHKVLWPQHGFTKGDLFRYYAQVSPLLLPVIADRPLVMRRFPNGIEAEPFYQHKVDDAPAGVRVVDMEHEGRGYLVGGELQTLLYTTQLASISQDPWFSRVQSSDSPDFIAIDLDPPEGVAFARVVDVARWVHDVLEQLGAPCGVKTSGADGMHVFVPMPPGTPYDTALLFAQLVATFVAERHPRHATTERSVKARHGRIYVDYLQNIVGKTLASAYSVRATSDAGVSTPLRWDEVDSQLTREAFTLRTALARFAQVGDLWQAVRESPGVDLDALARATHPRAQGASSQRRVKTERGD